MWLEIYIQILNIAVQISPSPFPDLKHILQELVLEWKLNWFAEHIF